MAELARACDIRGPSISNWLSGKTKGLSAKTALLAAEFLGVRPEWLANEDGPMLAAGDDQARNQTDARAELPTPAFRAAGTPPLSHARQSRLAPVLRELMDEAQALGDAEFARLETELRQLLVRISRGFPG